MDLEALKVAVAEARHSAAVFGMENNLPAHFWAGRFAEVVGRLIESKGEMNVSEGEDSR